MKMNSDRQTARLKRRAERLGPPSRSSGIHSNDASSQPVPDDSHSAISSSHASYLASSINLQRSSPTPTPPFTSMALDQRSSFKTPRDIHTLVEKLLGKLHGAPSAVTTRRTVIRLQDANSIAPATDAVRAVAERQSMLIEYKRTFCLLCSLLCLKRSSGRSRRTRNSLMTVHTRR